MAGELTLDFTKFSKLKASYNLKGKDMLSIVTGGNSGFIDGIKSVSASGSTLSVTVQIYVNQKLTTKTIKFTNVNPDMNIRAMQTTDPSTVHWGGDNTTVSDFYFNNKFGNGNRTWLSKPSATSVSGTVFNETINVSNVYVPTAKNLKKNIGVTINAGAGNDTIRGTQYNDIINGQAGNDTINATLGNDTITGGAGINTIQYNPYNFGNDTIKLTKGETLNINGLDFYGIADANKYKAGKNKNDLLITSRYGTVTVKNYYAKETGATVLIGGKNLVTEQGMPTVTAANYFEIENKKAVRKYTGTALADKVDARGVSQLTDKKNRPLATGVTISTGLGDDEIYGSLYNDAISAGKGNNIIHHYANEGNDTITLTKGENLTLRLDDIDKENLTYTSDKKGNFKISYTQGDDTGSVTLKNFYKTDVTGANTTIKLISSSGTIENLREDMFLDKINTAKNYSGSWLAEDIDASDAVLYKTVKKKKVEKISSDAGLTIKANGGNDIITGSNYSDTIKGGAGDDIITGGKGNDKLYGEAGKNTMIFTTGDGKDTVFSGKGKDSLVFENVDVETVTMKNNKKDLIINYGDGDSVTVKNYYNVNKKGKVTGVNTKNSVKNISFGDENGNETIYLGGGESTVKIDMSMFAEAEWSTPSYPSYVENSVKTIYLNDDASSTLTLDFDKALFDNGLGVFCRGTGQDRDLYISMSGNAEPGYGIVIKNYFDEDGNPRTNQVKLSLWEYPEMFATQKEQHIYTVPEWADGSYWERTFDVQPFGPYEGPIRGTNMQNEWLLYSAGFGDDIIYGGNGNREDIYLHGGHDLVYANEGDKHLNIAGNQTNVEIYLGSQATTKTNIYLGGVEGNVTSNFNEAGDLNISWDCYANNAEVPYVYTSNARVDKWNSRTSTATISIVGNNRDNILNALDGVNHTIDGREGDDTLIGGTGTDTFNFTYNNGYGVDTVQNYTSGDILQFESASSFPVDFSKFKFYKNDNGNNLVINTKDLSSTDSFVILKDYFNTTDKIDRIVAYNWSNANEETSLATLLGSVNLATTGTFELATGATVTGSDYEDVLIAKSGENTITGGKDADKLYSKDGENTFVFNTGDGSDTLYQEGGVVTLKFNNATINELSSATGYDKDSSYYDDLLIHYDGTNTLRVKDYYWAGHNYTTKIIDSTGTEYNMSDYFKRVQYINSYSDYMMRSSANKDEDIRVTANIGADIEGKKGSDIIRGSQYGEWLCSYTTMKYDYTFNFDKTAGVVDKIYAGGGNDVLVGNALTNYMYGDGGNDTFIVFASEGLNTIVSDSSGTSDALNIYDETYDNLHFVFNADSDGNIDNNGLRILNNENFDLWKANVNDENIKGISIINDWNCIENYEEAGDGNGCSHLTVATLETLKNEVVSWLTSDGRDYGSVSDVLTKENNGEDITALIAKFNISDQWVYQEY